MRRQNPTSKNSTNAGFTLIELVISMVIVLVILGFVSMIITGVQREYTNQRPRMEALSNAQLALDTMVRSTRMAGAQNPTCGFAFVITPLTPSASAGSGVYNALRVQADWNTPDCALNGVDEDVSFSVNGGAFYIDAAQAEPYVEGIDEIRFLFYDDANVLITDAITNADDIRYVRIEIDTSDATQTTLTSGVKVRSR